MSKNGSKVDTNKVRQLIIFCNFGVEFCYSISLMYIPKIFESTAICQLLAITFSAIEIVGQFGLKIEFRVFKKKHHYTRMYTLADLIFSVFFNYAFSQEEIVE